MCMLPTGCRSIDSVLGGGLVPKRINQVYGSSGSGKTNLCLQALVTAVESGKDVVYIDTEGGFSKKRLSQLYKEDPERLLNNIDFYRVLDFSQQEEVIDELENLETDLIIVDSLTSQYRPELSNGDAREVNKELGRQVNKLSKIAREKEIPILVTNQVYSDFESEKREVRPVGGDVLKYSSKVILQLEKKGRDRRAILQKHLFKKENESEDFRIEQTGLEPIGEQEDKYGR